MTCAPFWVESVLLSFLKAPAIQTLQLPSVKWRPCHMPRPLACVSPRDLKGAVVVPAVQKARLAYGAGVSEGWVRHALG